MHLDRISELLHPFLEDSNDRSQPAPKGLTAGDLRHISIYIDILQRWNARINLTAIREEEEIVTRHFGESLFAARHLFPNRSVSSAAKAFAVADVGSGAGFPGVPIKLWAPGIALTLIESNHKKATFLKELTRVLTLTNVDIQTARAESVPATSFDVVTLRAVERFESILPVAAGLVAPAGQLVLLIGQSQLPQAKSTLPALSWAQPLPIPNSESRLLAVACKTPKHTVKPPPD